MKNKTSRRADSDGKFSTKHFFYGGIVIIFCFVAVREKKETK